MTPFTEEQKQFAKSAAERFIANKRITPDSFVVASDHVRVFWTENGKAKGRGWKVCAPEYPEGLNASSV